LDSEIALIAERKEPVWFKDLAPTEIDPDRDGTPYFLQAVAKIQRPTAAFSNLLSNGSSQPPGADPVIVAELARNREVLDLLAECIRRPEFRLPVDYNTTQPFAIQLDAVQSARDLARLLSGDVAVALAAGDHARALECVERIYDLGELLGDEPFTISQLVRIAICSMAHSSLQQVLAAGDLTPDQFTSLDDRLEKVYSQFSLRPAMIAERAASMTTLKHVEENLPVLMDPSNEMPNAFRLWATGPVHPYRLSDQAALLGLMRDVIDAVDQPGRAGADAMQAIEARILNMPKTYVFSRLMLPAVMKVREAGMRHRQKLATTRLGIRVDRYFAEHGRFPESLDALVDGKIPAIPVDIFAGKPLVYRIATDGFVIYCTGSNGIDEGGGQTPDQLEYHTRFELRYPQLGSQPE
jgi:hypothetical protein